MNVQLLSKDCEEAFDDGAIVMREVLHLYVDVLNADERTELVDDPVAHEAMSYSKPASTFI